MKKILKEYSGLLILAVIIIGLDQYTKYLVQTNLAIGETWSPWAWLAPYARIIYWKNTGVAFGMFKSLGPVAAALAVVISVAIIYYFPRVPREDWALRLALILQLGGAIGNLIDRIRLGFVVDFVSVGNFAIFNVADSCITVSVVVLMLGILLQEKRTKNEKSLLLAQQQEEDRVESSKDHE